MAVSQDDLLIKIQADTANATASISALSKSMIDLSSKFDQLNKAALNTEKTVNGFGMTAMYLNQSLELAKKGFETVKKVLDATVFKFLQGEEHTKRLSNALRLMGSDSVTATTQHFKKLGEEMANLTGVGSETVEDMARLGVTMGLNTDQIDRYIRAAADASAATGIDMSQAFELVTQSLKGQTKGLASIIPEMKNFTDEQAKAGKAADYFAERMSGFAEANADSFSVTMKKNASALEDLQKALGSVVVDILNIGKGQNVIGEVLTSAKNLVQEYHDELVEIGRSTIDFFERVSTFVIAAVSGLIMVFTGSLAGIADLFRFKEFAQKMDAKTKEAAMILKEASKDLFSILATPNKEEKKESKGGPKGKPIASPVDPKITAQAAEYQKALSEIQKKTDELNLSARESGMTQLEVLDEELKMINKVIDAKQKEIQANIEAGKYSKEQGANLIAAFEDQRKAAGEDNDSKKEQAPGQEYDAAIKAGASMTNDITKAFQTGTMGMVTGMLGAVDAFVGAAQAVVDFIPGLLDKIANLFNSIADLPNKIANGLQKVLDSILNWIANTLPNWLKAIPKMLKMIAKFLVEGLLQAFNSLFDAVPQLLMDLINYIPEFVERFVQGIIQAVPLIVISFIQKILPKIPGIAIAIIKVLVIGLPMAIVKGVFEAWKAIAGSIKNLFKGIKFETPKFSGIGDAIKKLSGSTASLFGVRDLGGAQDSMSKASNKVADALKNGMDGAIKMLIDAWRWIYDNIIAPVGAFFQGVFRGIVDGARSLFDGLISGVQKVFGFLKSIFEKYTSFLGDMLNGIKNVGSTIIDTFKNIGNIIIDGIKGGLPELGKMFTKLFDEINPANLFKKLFDVSGAEGQGTVETTLGIDIPFLKFAQGGMVPGQSKVGGDSSLNDRILALLSPGEAVIPRSAMQDKRVRAIVDQILNGSLEVPAFKLGGVVGGWVDKASQAGSNIGGTGGKILSGDFAGAASDIQNMDVKKAGEELSKARDNAIKIVEAMMPGSPWKIVWDKVKEMVMKMFEANKFASGGLVTGASGTDMIPARLTAGEFVLNKEAVSNIGLGNLNRMNTGSKSFSSPTSITQNIDIKIDSKGERLDESFIRQRLMPVFKEELRRASLDGERLLSNGGVR
jgi:phage-related protein